MSRTRPRPCTCDRETCRLCWLYANDRRYRRLWGGSTEGMAPASREYAPDTLPCEHRGQQQDKINCGCSGDQWTYPCSLFGGCCILRKVPKLPSEYRDLPQCNVCPQRTG
jgi:hypothetical protein